MKPMNFAFKLKYLILFIGLILLSIVVPPTSAAGMSVVGVLGNGPSFDLVESNGYLYVGQGTEVRVYDITTQEKASTLTWKNSIAGIPIGSSVRSVTVDSGYLYIAAEGSFTIIDISNPSNPIKRSMIKNPFSGTVIYDVVVKGNTAYLLIQGAGVQVVDITSKSAPVIGNKVSLAVTNKPWRGTIDGNYLYIGMDTDNRLDILDISTPSSPRVAGGYSPNTTGYNSISGVAVKDGYAFITEYHNGVRVINISNPATPIEVTNLMGINANDIKILGNNAYVSIRYQGFSIIDISNPKSIKIIGKATDSPDYNEGIFPTKNYTFISLESMGFGIYNTSDVTAPKTVRRINVMGGADSLDINGNTLYIGGHNDGIWIVDVSNKSQPKELAFLSNGNGRNSDVHLQGNYLYIAGQWSRLCVADVSNPVNPRLVVDHFGDSIGSVLPDGNFVYTSAGIIDLTNISNPVYASKSSYLSGKFAKFSERYLLVTSGHGVRILDISDKKNPTLVSTFDNSTEYYDVEVYGNTAVGLVVNKIITFDLSNIKSPVKLGEVSYSGIWSGYSLSMNGAIAYASGTGIGQVRAFDISDPKKIKLIDSLSLSGVISSVTNENGYVYAGQKMGLYVLKSPIVTTTTPVVPVTTVIPVIPSPTVTPGIPTINDKIGVFRPLTHMFYQDFNGNGGWNGAVIDGTYNFGLTGDIPVSGDWNNEGKTEIGVFRPSTRSFYLDANGNGGWNGAVIDRSYNFGLTGDIPVSGDWNNDGKTEIGVFRPSTRSFYLDANGNGAWNGAVIDRAYNFGLKGDIPVSG
jgi:hypothetical protein